MENIDNEYKKRNPFSVPEGYFEQLPDKIMERIEEQDKPQKVGWIRLIKPYVGLAAIFMLALLVVQVVLPHFIDENKMLKINEGQIVTGGGNEIVQENMELDRGFNPTDEEIIEYLETEAKANDYDFIYAELY